MTGTLIHDIHQELTQAFYCHELDGSITLEMLPSLAEALEPHFERYITKRSLFPEPKTFRVVANNFIQDGSLVHAYLNLDTPEAVEYWEKLQKNLRNKTRQRYPNLSPTQHDEIVTETLKRVHKSLPNFLFLARLSTWITKIWQNEAYRLMDKIKKRQDREISLDKEDNKGLAWGERLASPQPSPEESAARDQAIEGFWKRIKRLEDELDVKILHWHLAGHTLEETKQALGEKAPSIATIKRRKDRIIERMKADELIREIAWQLGIG